VDETFEFRIPEDRAAMELPSEVGSLVFHGLVRVVSVRPDDPLLTTIGRLERKARKRDDMFFASWSVQRSYSDEELEAARFLTLKLAATIEPPGELCGTLYDEKSGCPLCGSGAPQVSPLTLRPSSLPRHRDFAKTIAGEVVVSDKTRRLFQEEEVSGAELAPVLRRSRGRLERNPDFHQLTLPGPHPVIDSRTAVGVDPFTASTPDTEPCPKGHLLGLNLVSEVRLRAETVPDQDVVATAQFIGIRRGVLRPERVIVVSRRLATAMKRRGLTGYGLEVAHLVD
jgi:hypothetical protein